MKTIVIACFVLSVLSLIFSIRAFMLSYVISLKAKIRSIPFLLVEDKITFERVMRVKVFCMVIINLTYVVAFINRMMLNYPPFTSKIIPYTTTIIHIAIFIISFAMMFSYDPKLSDFLTRNKKTV